MANIYAIEGIGPVYAEKLAQANIKNTEHLLKAGGTKTGRKNLAETAGIDEKLVLRWVNMADLFRIKGVGEEYSDLLEAAGVDTVKELGTRKADNLYAKLIEVNDAKKLVRQLPTKKKVEAWVSQARDLSPKVTH